MDEASPDLWALGVQGDANRPVLDTTRLKALTCLTYILDRLSMVLQRKNTNKTGVTHRSIQNIPYTV